MNRPLLATSSLPAAMTSPRVPGQWNARVMNDLNDPLTSSAILSYSATTDSLVHGITPSSISFFSVLCAVKYTESVSPYTTLSPLWSYLPATISLTLLAMCLVIHLPVSVTLCPILISKNLQPGFNIAPYRLFRLIFFTSCLLSQYSLSISLSPHSRIFFCISCLSAYQRFNSPGMIASYSYVNIVPLALNIHLLLPSNMISYSCAALIRTLVLSSQSTMISVPFSLFMTA